MRIAGTHFILAAVAAALLVLSGIGAAALWRYDHPTVGLIPLLQAPLYGVAAWLVLARPIPGRAALAGILLAGLAMRLIVLPTRRGAGLGRKLVDQCIAFGREAYFGAARSSAAVPSCRQAGASN